MSFEEKEELLEEQRLLKILLDFHVKNRIHISMNDKEFEDYVNAALDRLNELTKYYWKTKINNEKIRTNPRYS